MGNGEKNLLKFVVEDNYLVHIETMRPNLQIQDLEPYLISPRLGVG